MYYMYPYYININITIAIPQRLDFPLSCPEASFLAEA
jgi:hypothetical protein